MAISFVNDQNLYFQFFSENLAPSELKKLKSKQRKAKKKAEQENAQAKEAQIKRDQHHKSRQQGDVEPDAPQLDELIPEKLERVSLKSGVFKKKSRKINGLFF